MKQQMHKIIPVILCGGSGTRLWPMSRQDNPKQFLKLLSGNTLFQDTSMRALRISGAAPNEMVTVTLEEMKTEATRQLFEINKDMAQHVLGEPEARNTAAAFALAALHIRENFGDDALMLVLPSDHYIGDENNLTESVHAATADAMAGKLVTFGIRPTRPDTGYGYIRYAGEDKAPSASGVYDVMEFVEKPPVEIAQKYVDSGDYLWSSGMHLFKVSTVLEKYSLHAAETLSTVDAAFKNPSIYSTIAKQPFETAVLEKTDDVMVVPCDPKWSDIGSWDSFWDISEKNEHGNAILGNARCLNVENTLIHSNERLVTCIGVKDLIVIDTGDALLIAGKQSSDGLKAAVSALQKEKAREVERTAKKDYHWGTSKTITETDEFVLKEQTIMVGKSRSLKRNVDREESIMIVSGNARVIIDNEDNALGKLDSIAIPPKTAYCIVNQGSEPLTYYSFRYLTGQGDTGHWKGMMATMAGANTEKKAI